MSSGPSRPLITVISGTNRPGSRTRVLAEFTRRTYHDLGAEVWLIDLAAFPDDAVDATKEPPGFKEIADLFVAAKGLVIIAPEYNGEIPNVMKYFFGWIRNRANLQARPVCFIGLSTLEQGGAQAPVDQLHEIFGGRKNGYIYPVRMLLHDAEDKIDASSEMIDQDEVIKLNKQAEGFLGFCKRMKAGSEKF
ncbi:MAG: NADPH-dependent FMN reductase [Candidatus Methylacidiphilales bacterium]|nr:NADPH-dependent FMN reductase [Candidatus Methylacidiphilales bacterium]